MADNPQARRLPAGRAAPRALPGGAAAHAAVRPPRVAGGAPAGPGPAAADAHAEPQPADAEEAPPAGLPPLEGVFYEDPAAVAAQLLQEEPAPEVPEGAAQPFDFAEACNRRDVLLERARRFAELRPKLLANSVRLGTNPRQDFGIFLMGERKDDFEHILPPPNPPMGLNVRTAVLPLCEGGRLSDAALGTVFHGRMERVAPTVAGRLPNAARLDVHDKAVHQYGSLNAYVRVVARTMRPILAMQGALLEAIDRMDEPGGEDIDPRALLAGFREEALRSSEDLAELLFASDGDRGMVRMLERTPGQAGRADSPYHAQNLPAAHAVGEIALIQLLGFTARTGTDLGHAIVTDMSKLLMPTAPPPPMAIVPDAAFDLSSMFATGSSLAASTTATLAEVAKRQAQAEAKALERPAKTPRRKAKKQPSAGHNQAAAPNAQQRPVPAQGGNAGPARHPQAARPQQPNQAPAHPQAAPAPAGPGRQ